MKMQPTTWMARVSRSQIKKKEELKQNHLYSMGWRSCTAKRYPRPFSARASAKRYYHRDLKLVHNLRIRVWGLACFSRLCHPFALYPCALKTLCPHSLPWNLNPQLGKAEPNAVSGLHLIGLWMTKWAFHSGSVRLIPLSLAGQTRF